MVNEAWLEALSDLACVEDQLDQLRTERDQLRTERDQARAERDDLLAACEAAIDHAGGAPPYFISDRTVAQIKAALARARGEGEG